MDAAVQKLVGKTIHMALYDETRWLQPTEEQLRSWEAWVIEECVRRIMRHRFDCNCGTCDLRAELVGIKTAWCWSMNWRIRWERVAEEHRKLVEVLGPDAEGGQA